MAHTQIDSRCLFCKKEILPNTICRSIEAVKAVNFGIREGNIMYDPGKIIPVKEGNLRIRRFGNGYKHLAHIECFEKALDIYLFNYTSKE